jgi:hypothetical protein
MNTYSKKKITGEQFVANLVTTNEIASLSETFSKSEIPLDSLLVMEKKLRR